MRPALSRRAAVRITVLSFLLVFLLGAIVARLPSTFAQMTGGGGPAAATGVDVIFDVERLLNLAYVEKPEQSKLTKGAIDGMLEALDDPYAEYIPAEDAADFEKAMTGSFSGIGCQIEIRDSWLYVTSPLEDSPAFNAGILAGDKITKVDGKSTQGKTADQCIKMITGPEGTIVHVDVQRGGQDLAFDITRARIVSKSVRGFRREPGTGHWQYLIDPESRVAYIRLSQFTPTSSQELAEAIELAASEAKSGGDKSEPLGGLILDLRDNPGGMMEAALEIVDMFIDKGRIMSTRGRAPLFPNEIVYEAEPGGVGKAPAAPTYPIAVLINGISASASEIVSGSLSENDRAVAIGTRTYGKGLVQTVQALAHAPKASIKFTTQRYYLPSGKLIQRTDESADWGVDPSPGMFLPMTDDETIAWRLKRRDWDVLRKEGTALPEGVEPLPALADQRWTDPAWVESTAKDKQLAGALRSIKHRVAAGAGGDWLKLTDEADQHGKIELAELKRLEKTQLLMGKEFARIEKRIETLNTQASTGKPADKDRDFWPDALDLTGGSVEVRDKDGKVIANLKVTGRDVERWLTVADLEKTPEPKNSAKAQ